MIRATTTALLLLGTLLLAGPAPAVASTHTGVGVRHATVHVREARRALKDAQRVLTATKRYEALYGTSVARWCWLADDVGWTPDTWPTLFFVIERESGGSPKALNTQGSGAAGLLQLMPGWYAGDYYDFPDFDPYNPRLNLKYGYEGYKVSGWQPWSVQ
jgi:hypothetical protein